MNTEIGYQIEVELLSEAIFASGEKQRNLVQSMTLMDADGFVYLHGKSLKGYLKKQAFWLLERYRQVNEERAREFLHSIYVLFGVNDSERIAWDLKNISDLGLTTQGALKLGHLQLSRKVRNILLELMKKMEEDSQDTEERFVPFSSLDFLAAQTNIRTRIQLENGTVQDKKLTTSHTVKKGLIFYSDVYFHSSSYLDKETGNWNFKNHLDDLQRIVCSLDYIGAGVHRGRGRVKARLLVHGEEFTSGKVRGDSSEAIRGH